MKYDKSAAYLQAFLHGNRYKEESTLSIPENAHMPQAAIMPMLQIHYHANHFKSNKHAQADLPTCSNMSKIKPNITQAQLKHYTSTTQMIQDMPVKVKPRILQVELKWHKTSASRSSQGIHKYNSNHKTCVSRSNQGIHKHNSNDTRHVCQDQAKDFTSIPQMIQDMQASNNSTNASSLQPCSSSCNSKTKHAPIARGRSVLAITCQKIVKLSAGAHIAKSPQGSPPSKHYISIPPNATLTQHIRITRFSIHTLQASWQSKV